MAALLFCLRGMPPSGGCCSLVVVLRQIVRRDQLTIMPNSDYWRSRCAHTRAMRIQFSWVGALLRGMFWGRRRGWRHGVRDAAGGEAMEGF